MKSRFYILIMLLIVLSFAFWSEVAASEEGGANVRIIVPYISTNSNVPTFCQVGNTGASNMIYSYKITSVQRQGGGSSNSIADSDGDLASHEYRTYKFGVSSKTSEVGYQIYDYASGAFGTFKTYPDGVVNNASKFSIEMLFASPDAICNNLVFTCFQTDAATGGKRPLPVQCKEETIEAKIVEEGPAAWTECAREGEFCSFSGNRRVRYGKCAWSVKTFTDGVSCDSGTFADFDPFRRFAKCQLEMEQD